MIHIPVMNEESFRFVYPSSDEQDYYEHMKNADDELGELLSGNTHLNQKIRLVYIDLNDFRFWCTRNGRMSNPSVSIQEYMEQLTDEQVITFAQQQKRDFAVYDCVLPVHLIKKNTAIPSDPIPISEMILNEIQKRLGHELNTSMDNVLLYPDLLRWDDFWRMKQYFFEQSFLYFSESNISRQQVFHNKPAPELTEYNRNHSIRTLGIAIKVPQPCIIERTTNLNQIDLSISKKGTEKIGQLLMYNSQRNSYNYTLFSSLIATENLIEFIEMFREELHR